MLLLPVFTGFLATVLLVSLYFLAFVVRADDVFAARFFIPVAGVLFGNMLTVNIMAVNVYYSELQREQDMYYYLLGNRGDPFRGYIAFPPFGRHQILFPVHRQHGRAGHRVFPGTMIGQILGGSMPEVAIKYQLMISVITVVASMLSLVITISLSVRRTFDEFGRLKPIFRKGRNTK